MDFALSNIFSNRSSDLTQLENFVHKNSGDKKYVFSKRVIIRRECNL